MAELVGICGESGSGKSRSIRGLDPKETLIISVAGKAIPMRGFKKIYTPLDPKTGATGNYFKSSKAAEIIQILNLVNTKRLDIKNIVIDDYQFIMSFEFFEKADESGFGKFAVIGKNGADPLIKAAALSRDDLTVFIMAHDEEVMKNYKPFRKIKTIGKMVDEKLTMDGLFTTLLFTDVRKDDNDNITFGFVTHTDGISTAKSPEGMFEEDYIENDLGIVAKALNDYYGLS